MADSHIEVGAQILSTSTAQVTFSSIGSYRDYQLIISGNQASNTTLYIRVNGDSGSNYSWVRFYGDGSSVGSSNNASSTFLYPGDLGPGYSVVSTDFVDANRTNKHKTIVSRANGNTYVFTTASRWANTSAITSITITGSSNFDAGLSFFLYGIVG